jgi:hypothetical protein
MGGFDSGLRKVAAIIAGHRVAGEARDKISERWHMPCTVTGISTHAKGGMGRKTRASSLGLALASSPLRRFFMKGAY